MEPLCVAKHVTDSVHGKEGLTGINVGNSAYFSVLFIYWFVGFVLIKPFLAKHVTGLVHRKEGVTGIIQEHFAYF